MSILVVGSVAYDSVRTPLGSRQEVLGGSATYFSVAASYFAPIGIVAVVGEDFGAEDMAMLKAHRIDTQGVTIARGATFRWWGEYGEDMNNAHTLDTRLNVFADFAPDLPPQERQAPYLFLANIDPDLQYSVLEQMEQRPRLVAGDTMNFWIQGKRRELERTIGALDILMINEGEARLLAGERNLVRAVRGILQMGPRMLVIKRGEYGAIAFTRDSIFAAPAYPLETVVDPTGAGDSFAGGFMGHVAATGDTTMTGFRRAMVMGSVMASFVVESFGLERLRSLTRQEVQERFRAFKAMTYFEDLVEEGLFR